MPSSETSPPQSAQLKSWTILDPHLELDLPAEWLEFINNLLKDSGDSPEQLFRKALGLYRLALDAKKDGYLVGATQSPDCLAEEFEF